MPKLPYASADRYRKKVVNFRLSEPEYNQIVSAAELSGHSVSDFARAAMLGTSDPFSGSVPTVAEALSRVEQKLNVVLKILDRLGDGCGALKEKAGNENA